MTDAADVLAHARDRPASLGAGRLICIDGPSGSGKSTLAREIAALTPTVVVVPTDDLCPGWDGLPLVPGLLVDLVEPIARGRSGSYPRYDWILGHGGEQVVVEPAPVLIVEGVGAGTRLLAPWRTTLVWMDDQTERRRTRALARDGEYFRDYWDDWARSEATFFAANDLPAGADLTIRP